MSTLSPKDLQVIAAISGQNSADLVDSHPAQALGDMLIRDGLTGLYNRSYLQHRLALDLAATTGGRLTLCLIDLDGFKTINDSLGHGAGDQVLAAVADAIRRQLPAGGFAARYGGDEFVVVLPGGADLAAAVMARWQRYVAGEPVVLADSGPAGPATVSVGLSIGTATWPDDAGDYTGLLETADQAMYRQKLQHRQAVGEVHDGPGLPSSRLVSRPVQQLIPDGLPTFLCSQPVGPGALDQHERIVGDAVEDAGGFLCEAATDARVMAVFPSAAAALAAALTAQQALAAANGPDDTGPDGAGLGGGLTARMALFTGEAEYRQVTYAGPAVHRCQSLLPAGHGGQILLPARTAARLGQALPDGITLMDLGQHRLTDLMTSEHIFQVVQAAQPAEPPPLQTLDTLPNNLPQYTTSFVGRETETAQLGHRLRSARLVVVTGPAGTGKSRLALQAGARLLPEIHDGVWLVELAALSDPTLVPVRMAQVLGVKEEPQRPVLDTVIDYLRSRQALLIVDNCEHLVDACAAVLPTLLAACPGLRILATSRIPLGSGHEVTVRLTPLALPTVGLSPADLTDFAAIRLFVDRARHSDPGFEITAGNIAAVTEICRRLDGLPLALELAAARLKVLSAADIAARLADRFALLTSSHGALPHRQTLRATIDWSYDLLDAAERLLWSRLAVFTGTFTAAAVTAVCTGGDIAPDAVSNLLTSLIDKSLVVVETHGPEMQLRLLETVKEYGLERLRSSGEEPHRRRQHLAWYTDQARQAQPHLLGRGPDPVSWLDRLERDHDNLRAALGWAFSGAATELGLELAAELSLFWEIRGHIQEGHRWLLAALELAPGATSAHARILDGAGKLTRATGNFPQAAARHEAALTLWHQLGDQRGVASALLNLGHVALARCDFRSAWSPLAQSLAAWKQVGDPWGVAWAMHRLGALAFHLGELKQADSLMTNCLARMQQVGDPFGVIRTLMAAGSIAREQGDYERARALSMESAQQGRAMGWRSGLPTILSTLACTLMAGGDTDQAAALLAEALPLAQDAASKTSYCLGLRLQGQVALSAGDPDVAAPVLEAALDLSREFDNWFDFAAATFSLGQIAAGRGDDHRATALMAHSLETYWQIGDKIGLALALDGLAGLALDRASYLQAARLFGAAQALRTRIGAVLYVSDRARHTEQLVRVRSQLGEGAFAAAWAEGAALRLEQAVAAALELAGRRLPTRSDPGLADGTERVRRSG